MDFQLFLNSGTTVFALVGGVLFGFLLRKGGVSRFDTIIGQFLLKDFTVMKMMMTAIVVGSLSIYSLNELGFIPTFHLSKVSVLFAIIGGLIFGVGMSIMGYCPGTAIAAIAEGAKDAVFGFVGMLFGAAVFNIISPPMLPKIEQQDFAHKQTLSTILGVSPWVVILALIGVWVIFALAVRKFEQKT